MDEHENKTVNETSNDESIINLNNSVIAQDAIDEKSEINLSGKTELVHVVTKEKIQGCQELEINKDGVQLLQKDATGSASNDLDSSDIKVDLNTKEIEVLVQEKTELEDKRNFEGNSTIDKEVKGTSTVPDSSEDPRGLQQTDDEDEDDTSDEVDSDEENKSLPLFEQPVEVEGKRVRKQNVQFQIYPERYFPKKVSVIHIPEGRGTRLADIPKLREQIAVLTPRDLKELHRILFVKAGSPNNRFANIMEFKGFEFFDKTPEHKKKSAFINTLSIFQLKTISSIFGVNPTGKKLELVGRLLDFLLVPDPTKFNAREKSTRPRRKGTRKVSYTESDSDDEYSGNKKQRNTRTPKSARGKKQSSRSTSKPKTTRPKQQSARPMRRKTEPLSSAAANTSSSSSIPRRTSARRAAMSAEQSTPLSSTVSDATHLDDLKMPAKKRRCVRQLPFKNENQSDDNENLDSNMEQRKNTEKFPTDFINSTASIKTEEKSNEPEQTVTEPAVSVASIEVEEEEKNPIFNQLTAFTDTPHVNKSESVEIGEPVANFSKFKLEETDVASESTFQLEKEKQSVSIISGSTEQPLSDEANVI